jgi:phospholipid transport system substrate-binding protein
MSGIGSCALILTLALPSPASAGEATEAIKSSAQQLQRIMTDEEMTKPERDQERWHLLEKINAARFNYDEMAKRSLGAQWSTLKQREREEFVAAFQNFMSAVYSRLQGTAGDYIQYLNERPEADYIEVRALIPSYKAEMSLNYRLVNNGGNWRIYDLVVDGVSMVENYRGQFNRIMQFSSLETLVDQLRTRSLDIRY